MNSYFFKILLNTVDDATSVNGKKYSEIQINQDFIIFKREGKNEFEKIEIAKLYRLFKEESAIDTKLLKNYGLSGVQSPTLAVLIKAGFYKAEKKGGTHPRINDPVGVTQRKLKAEFAADGSLYQLPIANLIRHFLARLLNINTYKLSFEELSKAYMSATNESIPSEENAFYSYLFKIYFEFDREPREALLESYEISRKHLEEVSERIEAYELEIKLIEESKSSSKMQENMPVLRYYLDFNKQAYEGILDFLKYKVYHYVHNQCDINLKGLMPFGRVRYNYEWNPKAYELRYPTFISNKFGEVTWQKGQDIKRLFLESPTQFDDFLSEYIEHNAILFTIRREIEEIHIFENKTDIINEALDAFENKKFVSFSSIVAIIIEGIFHELCLDVGCKENDLLKKGFGQKVDYLRDKLSYTFHYEYYNFKFRLIRNKIAHGLFNSEEVESWAKFLLLDLKDAIDQTRDMKIPHNLKRFFLSQAFEGKSAENYRYLCAFLFLSKIDIPEFYDVKNNLNKVNRTLNTNGFWDFIQSQIDEGGEAKNFAYTIIKLLVGNQFSRAIRNRSIEKKKTVKDGSSINIEQFISKMSGNT